MTWATQHVFANAELVRATWVKSLWNNVAELHNPESDYVRQTADNAQNYASTTSGTFVNVDGTFMKAQFTLSVARRVLVTANVVSYASTGTTEGELGIAIDGVTQGGTDGWAVVPWLDNPVLYSLMYVTNELSVGEHLFTLQHRRSAGAGTINTAIFSRHWFYAVAI
jgi:hypothetical protein